MSHSGWARALFAVALTTTVALTTARPAQARHTDTERIVENSAHTLRQGEFMVGPLELSYGVVDTLQVGTYLLPWTLAALPKGQAAPNANLKWRIYETERWAFGTRLGFLTMDASQFSVDDARISAVPVELIVSWRPPNWVVSAALEVVYVNASGNISTGGTHIDGVGVGTTTMLELSAEWRRSETFAWVFEFRSLTAQSVVANGAVISRIDDQTTVEVHGNGDADLSADRTNITASAFWSWDHFNLKLGGGYGHYNIPFVNFFLDAPSPIVELDLFWRF